MKKNYVLDTNVLLDNEKCIEILRNGVENNIYIPEMVIEELDRLKKTSKRYMVARVLAELEKHKEHITILKNKENLYSADNAIMDEIIHNEVEEPVFVTNDKLLRFKAEKRGIASEPFKDSSPFKAESQRHTGFVNVDEGEALIKNCFYWKEGRLKFNNRYGEEKSVPSYENSVWKITPKNAYQQAAIDLMLNDEIDLVTIQSDAGMGKSFISLACMMYQLLELKKFKKMYIFKANIEIGNELGFLPGRMEEKMAPYFKSVTDLLLKLHEIRPASRLFKPTAEDELGMSSVVQLNNKYIELLPLNYIRGMNFDDCIVLIDEFQNISKNEARTLLSRMGENVKCICTGDVKQIDNTHLDQDNNGLNHVVKLFTGADNYGHIVLSGNRSRGPIADLVREKGL